MLYRDFFFFFLVLFFLFSFLAIELRVEALVSGNNGQKRENPKRLI